MLWSALANFVERGRFGVPKLGAEPIRKAALINAAISTVGQARSLDVTVAEIARRAGMSPALAHHYFGSKDRIFLAAMRQILLDFGLSVADGLRGLDDPKARLRVIVEASFDPINFRSDVASAWLNFYALARVDDQAARLLRIYHRRLRSNLLDALRRLAPDRAGQVADTLGALIDGVYLRLALDDGAQRDQAVPMIMGYIEAGLARVDQ